MSQTRRTFVKSVVAGIAGTTAVSGLSSAEESEDCDEESEDEQTILERKLDKVEEHIHVRGTVAIDRMDDGRQRGYVVSKVPALDYSLMGELSDLELEVLDLDRDKDEGLTTIKVISGHP